MNDWLKGAEARELRASLLWQLDQVRDDRELRNRMEGMTAAPLFGALSWLWAPRLYARNRALFRPFITQHFTDLYVDTQRHWQRVDYAGEVAQALDAWLPLLEREEETALFRRVWAWKHREGWGVDQPAWRRELARAFGAATPARRPKVLELYGQSAQLDEEAALALYAVDAALAGPFILRHLPWRGWRQQQAAGRWTRLERAARAGGAEDFAWKLYRQQVEEAEWGEEALALCARVREAEALCAALEQRHPETLWSDLGTHFVRMMEARGLDVLPYVRKHLRRVHGGFRNAGSYGALETLARKRGWTDFWAAVVVSCAPPAEYNKALAGVLADRALDEAERRRRLSLLSGVSREWNGLGWGLAVVKQLDAANALALYRYDRALLTQHFKAHVTPAWGEQYLELFEAAWAAGDEELADYLASRYATRQHGTRGKSAPDAREIAAGKYLALKLDEAAFARRAAAVLSLVPAYSIWSYDRLIEHNRFARLLFERSLRAFLAVPAAVRDLVEGGEIHVQQLAYRVLGLDDARARAQAGESLDILFGTLLRPLHRGTRLAAFAALQNAASTEPYARLVLEKCREAFALPDRRYPKEALVGMIGKILARFPALAGADEQRVIHRRVA